MAGDVTARQAQELRVIYVLGRFIKPGDEKLSERDLILALFERYQKYLKEEIIDVNE